MADNNKNKNNLQPNGQGTNRDDKSDCPLPTNSGNRRMDEDNCNESDNTFIARSSDSNQSACDPSDEEGKGNDYEIDDDHEEDDDDDDDVDDLEVDALDINHHYVAAYDEVECTEADDEEEDDDLEVDALDINNHYVAAYEEVEYTEADYEEEEEAAVDTIVINAIIIISVTLSADRTFWYIHVRVIFYWWVEISFYPLFTPFEGGTPIPPEREFHGRDSTKRAI